MVLVLANVPTVEVLGAVDPHSERIEHTVRALVAAGGPGLVTLKTQRTVSRFLRSDKVVVDEESEPHWPVGSYQWCYSDGTFMWPTCVTTAGRVAVFGFAGSLMTVSRSFTDVLKAVDGSGGPAIYLRKSFDVLDIVRNLESIALNNGIDL